MKELAERKERKAKKPRFRKQDAHKKDRLSSSWRKPRGRQSKIRLSKRGYARAVSSGWSSPAAAKGLSREGLLPVRVSTLAELEALDPKRVGAIINSNLGAKKRELLLTKALEKKITILNLDAEKTLAAIKERRAAQEQAKDARAAKKAKQAKKKPIEEKVQEEEKDADAEKQAAEAEKQKVLTKKQ